MLPLLNDINHFKDDNISEYNLFHIFYKIVFIYAFWEIILSSISC